MRYRMAFLSVGLMAAAGLLAATAMAADPVPAKNCTTPNGWAVATDGLIYDSVSNTTKITYNIGTTGSTPDHVGTFVRAEAGTVTTDPSASKTEPCGGDSVIGIASNAVCHERIVRFNNQANKSTTFTLSVSGKRLPITTSVVVRKGNNQGACRIVGFGLEDTSAVGDCVHQCGDFDGHQAVRTVETFKFKGCEVAFDFDPITGEVTQFDLVSQEPGVACYLTGPNPINELTIDGVPLFGNNGVKFGDGWISSGEGSCSTRLIAGRYCTVCKTP
jgi:hypothetical protein